MCNPSEDINFPLDGTPCTSADLGTNSTRAWVKHQMIARALASCSLRRLWKNKLAAVATEYAFIIAFISIVSATGMTLLGNNLSGFFSDIGTSLTNMACAMPDTASDTGKDNSSKCK